MAAEVLLIEAIPIVPGDEIRLAFEQVNSPWRQGVWLATHGLLNLGGHEGEQFVLWSDTAPPAVSIRCETTDGLLRLYNIWDSHRGRRPHESQSATSGMVVERLADGSIRYRCNDIGTEPSFDKLVFRVTIC